MTEKRRQFPSPFKVLLVDDHPVFRKGLRSLLEDEDDMQIVGEAGEGQEALDLIEKLSPDTVVMDVSMPGLNGIEATKRIVEKFPSTVVVALSIHSDKQFVQDMLKAGAMGYILKESVPEELVKGLRATMLGEGYLSPSITKFVVTGFRNSLTGTNPEEDIQTKIIATKMHAPHMPGNYVLRPRLLKFLDTNRHLPLQVVTAPAGYGKSTLVSCWIESNDWPSAWISLDEYDNDLKQFVSYLVHAINSFSPDALQESASLTKAAHLPPVQVLATTLINDIDQVDQDFIIVMDDFHLIANKEIHDLLSEILRHPPAQLHLIIAGRTDPFLPTSKLRAQGMIAEVRALDLRFTELETFSFFQQILGENIDESLIQGLHNKTEGWITGLRLASLSLLHREDMTSLLVDMEGSGKLVKEYLFNEVLAAQPEDIRNHLLFAAIPDQFCAPLLDALCPYGKEQCQLGSWKILHWLMDNNLFIVSLDSENYWFRFHHLFRELLKKQLQRHHSQEEICSLHSKASAWFAEHGFIEEAVHHALQANDIDGAIRLVGVHRVRLLNEDEWYVLEKILSLFDPEIIQQSPELLMCQTWIHYHRFEIPMLPLMIERLKNKLVEEDGRHEILSELNFFQGYIYYFTNNGQESQRCLEDALKKVPKTFQELAGQIEILYGLTLQMNGFGKDALQRINDLYYTFKDDNTVRKTRLLVTGVYFHIIAGNLPEALLVNQQLHEFSEKGSFTYALAWSNYLEGLINFYQNNLEHAIACFEKALGKKYVLHTRATIDCMVGLILACQMQEDSTRAAEFFQAMKDYITPLNDPACLEIIHSCQARLAILQQKTLTEPNWAQHAVSGVENMVWWLESPRITHCRILVAKGTKNSISRGESCLLELLDLNKKNHNICQTLRILPLLSLAYTKQHRHEEAFETLEQAISLAQKGDWIWPFVEHGSCMKEMLEGMKEKTNSPNFVKKVISSLEARNRQKAHDQGGGSQNPLQGQAGQSLEEPLTGREVEILTLLHRRYSNKEIGDTLFISTETVKSHLKNIYAKLEVGKRKEAVLKAVALGILSD